jgi:hypothetical protein
MLNVEMPRADATPKEALAAIQERIQREKTTRESKQASPIRKSSRIESAASSPARKEGSPAVKKKKGLLLRNHNSNCFLMTKIARVREKKYEEPK